MHIMQFAAYTEFLRAMAKTIAMVEDAGLQKGSTVDLGIRAPSAVSVLRFGAFLCSLAAARCAGVCIQ